jgi:predicted DNA-binding antitoxin AbrB/MazE fold protein
MIVRAIFEGGVFRPLAPVHLPEQTEVEFEPIVVNSNPDDRAAQERIYALLGKSYDTGETDLAERHNEHQPCWEMKGASISF